MGACSRELVSVATCHHFRDSSTVSVRQRRVHILKTGNSDAIKHVQFPVVRVLGSHFTPGMPITGEIACQPEQRVTVA